MVYFVWWTSYKHFLLCKKNFYKNMYLKISKTLMQMNLKKMLSQKVVNTEYF